MFFQKLFNQTVKTQDTDISSTFLISIYSLYVIIRSRILKFLLALYFDNNRILCLLLSILLKVLN